MSINTPTTSLEALRMMSKIRRSNPSVELVEIDPKLALEMLGTQARNRKLGPETVGKYAREMSSGRFGLTGDTIKFDSDGRLIDGQHRLRAVVASGVTIKMFVATGIRPEFQDVVDVGRSRQLKDVLSMRGEANTTGLASATRNHFLWMNGAIVNQSIRPTTAECLEWLDLHPELKPATAFSKELCKAVPGLITSAVAPLVYESRKFDVALSGVFWEMVKTGINLHESSPALALRDWAIRRGRTSDRRGRPGTPTTLAVGIKAWSAFCSGRSCKLLRWGSEEPFPIMPSEQ